MLQVSELYIYPIKSLPGIAIEQALVTEKGFKYDRQWMLIDENNQFVSQRQVPAMTQFIVSILVDGLFVQHKLKESSIIIPFNTSASDNPVELMVWDDNCIGEFVSVKADAWFSEMLNLKCRLVYMPNDYKRTVDQRYANKNTVTSFADGYPFLLIGQATLDNLNKKLIESLPINRFRPNIVFTGGEPHEEDLMGHFTIRQIDFYGVKLCARCVITTIDQQSGAKAKEPLKTLASYRLKNKNIYFGQNLIHSGKGFIAIGDQINTISQNDDERFMIPAKVELDN